MVHRFEEISNNAWPALQTMQYDGWILRFANGVTKRSNSVNLLYPSSLDPDHKIGFCEGLYQSQKITPCFKITPVADPAGIDLRLASRGYFIHSTISFQTLDISMLPPEPISEISIETELNPGWVEDFIRMNEFDPRRKSTYLGIMKQLRLPKCLVSLSRGHQTIGVGLGVVEGNFIGLFDIVVDKAYRNTGLGYLLVENILRWGRKRGADTAYLQVLCDNFPAIRLYEKMGFKEAYRYWYRMKG
ncbi:MAG: GNAT family N-acetyltransferase [Bacteroidetes bacterium]|nr:GNAT family N-acetyltransferase [Bacteroidota bacterium]